MGNFHSYTTKKSPWRIEEWDNEIIIYHNENVILTLSENGSLNVLEYFQAHPEWKKSGEKSDGKKN